MSNDERIQRESDTTARGEEIRGGDLGGSQKKKIKPQRERRKYPLLDFIKKVTGIDLKVPKGLRRPRG